MAYCKDCGVKDELCKCGSNSRSRSQERQRDRNAKPSTLSAEALSIVTAINSNTDAKLDSLKNEFKQDMDTFKSALSETKSRVDGHDERFKALEATIDELRSVIDELKGTTTRSVGHTDTEWQPRFVYVRGFAPFGADQSDKLTNEEYTEEAEKFMQVLPDNIRSNVSVDPPYVRSHQLTFRCSGGRRDCEVVRNYFYHYIEEQVIWIRDKAVKAVIEASPQQRAKYKTFFAALEVVKSKLTPDKYEVCVRTMQITSLSENALIGGIKKDSTVFDWNQEVCAKLGVPQ